MLLRAIFTFSLSLLTLWRGHPFYPELAPIIFTAISCRSLLRAALIACAGLLPHMLFAGDPHSIYPLTMAASLALSYPLIRLFRSDTLATHLLALFSFTLLFSFFGKFFESLLIFQKFAFLGWLSLPIDALQDASFGALIFLFPMHLFKKIIIKWPWLKFYQA